ncbi:hypothetical protein SAMN05216480_110104 [Pustulibacterium marinum]|uniref:Cardiolipin synthase N-terminal domain-containing protein n=1 Tax=Pustulibacterium marinum TaxID=1224947 RepID=A0A1I7HPF0_9FLAO|nr:hypothetical protein [Pustulibacterium marinum]SFU62625.1 hypothetical protein SAMN05216480_110104 [Pustulibacterium marinum]
MLQLFYYIGIALQAYCVYHAYRNHKEYYWFFIIVFIPTLGALIYLFTQVVGVNSMTSTVNSAQQEAFKVLYPSKRINDLEKRLEFSDTFENRVSLADAYLQNGRLDDAIEMYLSALKGHYENDYYAISKLVSAYFQTEQFELVISYTEKIQHKVEFKHSRTQFLYAVALEKTGNLEAAEAEFHKIDVPYKNYDERYYFANYLVEKGEKNAAEEILKDMLQEGQHMQRQNRRRYSFALRQARELLDSLEA